MSLSQKQFDYLATKDDISGLRKEMNDKFDRVLTVVDGIAQSHKDHEVEHVANLAAHDRFEERISKLEGEAG